MNQQTCNFQETSAHGAENKNRKIQYLSQLHNQILHLCRNTLLHRRRQQEIDLINNENDLPIAAPQLVQRALPLRPQRLHLQAPLPQPTQTVYIPHTPLLQAALQIAADFAPARTPERPVAQEAYEKDSGAALAEVRVQVSQ